MKLITINSNSSGNSYALVSAGGEILLLEAGIKMADVKKAIDYRIKDVVGCLASHCHGDHAKYATEYAKFGVKVYCNQDVINKKQFPYGSCKEIHTGKTFSAGSFRVAPIDLHHDVPNNGFLIQHKDMGTLCFITDTYKMGQFITGIDHWLIEANYDDRILKANVEDGKIDRAQANRLMLSHLSLDNTVNYLRMCEAQNARTITICHLSERNSDPALFKSAVESALGVPTFVATKNLVVDISKDII